MNALLLVESNTTGTGRLFARTAAGLGIRPVMLCADPARYPYLRLDGVETVVVDTSDSAAVISAALVLAERYRVVGALSSSEYFVAAAADVASVLGLPGPEAAAVRRVRDKGVQRALLAGAGVPVPRFAVVGDGGAAVASAGVYPVVVKPVQGSGSLGVRLCADAVEVAGHAGALLARDGDERGAAVPARVLVEEHVVGPEFSVEVFGTRVVAVTGKRVGPLPHFVEMGHDVPAATEDGVEAVAVDAVRACGLGWAAAHVEVRVGPSGPVVIEVNPRLAGGMIPELVRSACGVDLVGAQVRAAVGLPVDVEPRPGGSASIRFLTGEGRVEDSAGAVAAALGVDGVVDAVMYRSDGDEVGPATDFRDRIGHVIAVGTSAADRGLRALRIGLRRTEMAR